MLVQSTYHFMLSITIHPLVEEVAEAQAQVGWHQILKGRFVSETSSRDVTLPPLRLDGDLRMKLLRLPLLSSNFQPPKPHLTIGIGTREGKMLQQYHELEKRKFWPLKRGATKKFASDPFLNEMRTCKFVGLLSIRNQQP
jgi:hypothetical protein